MVTVKKSKILYLATKNQGKLKELITMLGKDFDVRLCSDLDKNISWDETGETFVENALIKAQKLREYTNHPVLADDSGLEVEALDGAPGVYSSRYGGIEGDDERNNKKLLAELTRLGVSSARARFVCFLVYLGENGEKRVFEGSCEGHIASKPRGNLGFGYDPLFVVAGGERTLAEYSKEEKNTVSHRSRALEKFHKAMSEGASSS